LGPFTRSRGDTTKRSINFGTPSDWIAILLGSSQLGIGAGLKGAPSDAIAEYQRALELNDDPVFSRSSAMPTRLLEQDEARELLATK